MVSIWQKYLSFEWKISYYYNYTYIFLHQALAYYCNRNNIRIMAVLPEKTAPTIINRCKEYGAKVVLFGEDFAEAKRQAFILSAEMGSVYINGWVLRCWNWRDWILSNKNTNVTNSKIVKLVITDYNRYYTLSLQLRSPRSNRRIGKHWCGNTGTATRNWCHNGAYWRWRTTEWYNGIR